MADTFEDGRALVDDIERALKEYLDEEETRLENEVDYLREVYSGTTGESASESSSSQLSDFYLVGNLSQYFPG